MTELIGPDGLLFVASAAIFGPLTGWIAGRRDRNPIVWLVFGALLGPIALLILAVAPPGRCPRCDAPVQGWQARCPVCGGPLSSHARAESATPRPATASAAIDATRETIARLWPARRDPPAPPTPLPVGRLARPSRTPRSDLRSGAASAHAPAGHHSVDAAEVLATAVYFGGTARLVVGSRYLIVRHGAVLRMLGPVDQDPSKVALERPLAGLTATAIGERLIITEGPAERFSLTLAIGAFGGASGPQLEIALSAPGEPSSGRWPASG